MAHGSSKAVITALVANAVLTVLKFIAATVTHSASMMNEAIHSLMDSLNQGFLLIGLKVAERPADANFAFGHGQKKYLWNLWSAIGLFSIGCGLGLSHAWHSWEKVGTKQPPAVVELFGFSIAPLWIAAMVLFIALILDGYSLFVAVSEFSKRMRAQGETGFLRSLLRSDDPTLVAVVLEDTVATLGVLLASTGILLTVLTGNPYWDIGFSAMIAVLLGLTAFFLGAVNMRYLSDVRDQEAEAVFADLVGQHREVERYHDLRSIIIDDQHTILSIGPVAVGCIRPAARRREPTRCRCCRQPDPGDCRWRCRVRTSGRRDLCRGRASRAREVPSCVIGWSRSSLFSCR